MGPRSLFFIILTVLSGIVLIAYQARVAVIDQQNHIPPPFWTPLSTVLVVVTALCLVGGVIGAVLDYKADQKMWPTSASKRGRKVR